MHAAERIERGTCERIDLRGIGDVGAHADRLRTGCAHRVERRGQHVGIDIGSTIFMPSDALFIANARPKPLPAPVMTATFPSKQSTRERP